MSLRPQANPHLVDTGTPPIPEAKAWLQAYRGERGPPIDLSQAAPAQPPPPPILAALAAAAADPATARYGAIHGDPALREAYAAELSRSYGARFAAGDSVITTGCNQAFILAMLAVAKAGDAVMLPYPWYFNHKMALDMLGIETLPLPCRAQNGFVPSVEDAAALASPRLKAIVLVTPNNPTGAIYPEETIAAFASLAAERGLWLILDETYRDFLPPEQERPHGLFTQGLPDHVISLYSFSKAYCLPGYRLGALTAPPALQAELSKALDTVQICPPRIGQVAVAATMAETLPWREENRRAMAARAEAFRAMMKELPDWRLGSIGAYFAYVRPPSHRDGAAGLAQELASRHGVLTLPASYFGPEQEDWLRVAFANADQEALTTLGKRIRSALSPG
jgi:aspartate/methionine/tyrosine aminotransferase